MKIGKLSFENSAARLLLLPVVVIAAFVAWIMLPEPSDAEDQSAPGQVTSNQVTSSQVTLAPVTLTSPAQATAPADAAEPAPAATSPETTAAEKAPIDGLRISSQSWRRGGLGSKALVTLTLRNRNDYAVKDIEIACAFTRRDGSHLTDRKRVITDTVNMKSRKTYAGMLVGFVNVNANKAKCSLVTASRI
jgi:hypothetical protein